jgi:hypothetical protein
LREVVEQRRLHEKHSADFEKHLWQRWDRLRPQMQFQSVVPPSQAWLQRSPVYRELVACDPHGDPIRTPSALAGIYRVDFCFSTSWFLAGKVWTLNRIQRLVCPSGNKVHSALLMPNENHRDWG